MTITVGSLSAELKTTYEKRLLTRAVSRMVHGKWATQATLSKSNQWEARKFGTMPLVSAPLTEGVTPGEQAAPSITTVTLSPSFYGSWISYTDQLEMQAFDPVVSEVSGILGEQAGLSLDVLLRNALTDGATAAYSGTVTARANVTDTVDYADWIGALALLQVANALPAEGELFPVVVHPFSYAQLMQDSTFVGMFQQSAPEVMRTGQMGTILNCAIYVSANARTYDNAGATNKDVYSMLFIGRESHAIAGMSGKTPNLTAGESGGQYSNNTGKSVNPVSIIMKPLGSSGSADPLNQRGTIGWMTSYDDVILNSAWIVNLEHATSYTI
jgi:N4-gp56 family major capsid protein